MRKTANVVELLIIHSNYETHNKTNKTDFVCSSSFKTDIALHSVASSSSSNRLCIIKTTIVNYCRNQGTHNVLHNMHPSGHGICFSSLSQFTPKLPVRRAESLHRRAMRIIFRHVTYGEALGHARLGTLFDRRKAQTVKMFQEIINNPDHKLHRFLPFLNKCCLNLRNSQLKDITFPFSKRTD